MTGSNGVSFIFPILLIVIFYFLLIRPQKKREKQITTMRNSLTVGDKVVTIGGFAGTVKKIKEDIITVEIKPDNISLEISRWAISSNESQVEVAEVKQPQKEEKAEEIIDSEEIVDAEIVEEEPKEEK